MYSSRLLQVNLGNSLTSCKPFLIWGSISFLVIRPKEMQSQTFWESLRARSLTADPNWTIGYYGLNEKFDIWKIEIIWMLWGNVSLSESVSAGLFYFQLTGFAWCQMWESENNDWKMSVKFQAPKKYQVINGV